MKNLLNPWIIFASLFFACETNEPCSLTLCANGASCENGQCICAPGYGGDACQELDLPATYRIRKVRISQVPQADADGLSFDPNSGPDIYLQINQGSVSKMSQEKYTNANDTDSYLFDFGEGVDLNTAEDFEIRLFDEDTDEDDEILLARSGFKALDLVLADGYQAEYAFPAQVAGNASISLDIDWGF